MRRTLVGMDGLRFAGRPVAWLGLGAPDAVGSGIAALQTALAQLGGAGMSPSGSISGLQAAGLAAVQSLGPVIDALSGGNSDVMKLTQAAWQQNGKLAAIVSSDAAPQSAVDSAKAIATQMLQYYQQAAKLAASKAPPGSVPDALPPPTGLLAWLGTLSPTVKTAASVGAAVVLVGGAAAAVAASRRRAA